MKLTVKPGIRCVHEGVVVADGGSGDVPDDVGRKWVNLGWAQEVPPEQPKSSRARGA